MASSVTSKPNKQGGKDVTVKVSDSVSASGGPGAGGGPQGQKPGISTRKIGGGGGGGFQPEQPQEEQVSNQAQLRERRIYEQSERQREEERQRQARIAEQEERQRERYPTSTRVIEKGGAIIQETRGDYGTLQRLKGQQPGSALVQTQAGEYVLLRSEGLNLREEATIGKININIGLEGGEPYNIVERPQKGGGTLYTPKLVDSIKTSSDFGGSVIGPSAEGAGKAYSIQLFETISTGGPEYQKTREAQPREIAEMISRGEIPPTFIGYKGGGARRQEVISLEQQGFKEPDIFPITYTTEEGKEIVTITGKSEGAEYNIYQPQKSAIISLYTEEKPQPKNIVQIAQESSPLYKYIGGRPSGVEEELKSGLEGIYQAAAAPKPIFTDILGRTPEEEETLRKSVAGVKEAYPKELIPLETPVSRVLSGKSPETGYGPRYDIGATATAAAGLIFDPRKGISFLSKAVRDIPSLLTSVAKKEKRPLTPIGEEYQPSRLPVSKAPETYPAGELIEFQKQKIPLGKALTKAPEPKPAQPKLVETDVSYTPGRYPVSRFPETYPRGELAGITETRIELGVGLGKPVSTSRFAKTELQLGRGQTKIPGIDFTEERINLGKGAVKTPERIIGKTEGPPPSVKEEFGYSPTRLPVSRFPETYPRGELAGIAETKIELGKGIGRLLGGAGKPERIIKQKPPKPPSPETEARISKGLILLMKEEPKLKQFTETKIELGRSEKILQIQEGKVIRDTISKTKAKPSQSFYYTPKSTSAYGLEYEYTRYPPESQIKIKQITKISPKVTTKETQQLTTTERTRQKEKTTLLYGPRQTQKEKQRFGSLFARPVAAIPKQKLLQPQKPIEKQKLVQELIEEPPKKPPVLILKFGPPRQRKERKTQESILGSTKEFLGNVPLRSITGTYKRKEVIYGEKRVQSLLGYERRGNKPKKRKSKKSIDPFAIKGGYGKGEIRL